MQGAVDMQRQDSDRRQTCRKYLKLKESSTFLRQHSWRWLPRILTILAVVPAILSLGIAAHEPRQAFAKERQPIKIVKVTNAKYGLAFAVPVGWTPQVGSTYQVVARGKEGGLSTHVVVNAIPAKAVRDFFIWSEEAGEIHKAGRWTCAASRSWRLNPHVSVAICGEQMTNGHVLMVSIVAEKEWLRRAGGEELLRRLVANFRGFRADDD
jgi:hypothetical protein